MKTQIGRAAKIREFVKANPESTTAAIAAGIGESWQDVTRELSRMVSRGTVIASKGPAKSSFSIGREPWEPLRKPRVVKATPPKPPKPAKDHPYRDTVPGLQRKSARHTTPEAAQTVEEFMAKGGKVEVLPVAWADQERYPRAFVYPGRPRTGTGD